jgi:hypothetical protein
VIIRLKHASLGSTSVHQAPLLRDNFATAMRSAMKIVAYRTELSPRLVMLKNIGYDLNLNVRLGLRPS